MLLVPTYLAASSIHGIGLFSKEFIRAGTIVCVQTGRFDDSFPRGIVDDLPAEAADFIRKYGYLSRGAWYLNADHMRFCNHSPQPNLKSEFDSIQDVALMDIPADVELTVNYYNFDEAAVEKLRECLAV
jgi:SET domain-containing protein